MSTRSIALVIALFGVVLIGVFDHSEKIGFCSTIDHDCRRLYDDASLVLAAKMPAKPRRK